MNDIYCILNKAIDSIKTVPGVRAVVFGGSRARETHTTDFDIDIGIYYDSKRLDLARLETVAVELDDEHREKLIAPSGERGNWVNVGELATVVGFVGRNIPSEIHSRNIPDETKSGNHRLLYFRSRIFMYVR